MLGSVGCNWSDAAVAWTMRGIGGVFQLARYVPGETVEAWMKDRNGG